MDKVYCINYLLDRNILVSANFFDENVDTKELFDKISNSKTKPLVVDKNIVSLLKNLEKLPEINWFEFERACVEVNLGGNETLYNTFLNILSAKPIKQTRVIEINESEKDKIKAAVDSSVLVLQEYQDQTKPREVKDFVEYFKLRYESLKKILLVRTELQDALSIQRMNGKKEGEKIAVIGLVVDKVKTKNENIRITLEDNTGTISVLFSKNNQELLKFADTLVMDECIGITGVTGNKILFANNLLIPDVPISHELKKSPDEEYAVFISDIQIGSNLFLSNEFSKFIKWISGEYGNESQKDIARKVKYLFIPGDLVEGVGVYPGQEAHLTIKDVKMQYDELARYLSTLPSHIKIILCGGNHDAIRLSEPQPVLDKKYAAALYELPNVTVTTNPSLVNIGSSESFGGFDVLLYHGGSFPYYAEEVAEIRAQGGMDKIENVKKFLLQRRHLCPTHSAYLYIPDTRKDPLVIEKVPDIFISGHVHRARVASYRNVSLINCGCWTSQSENEEKRGIIPEPARAIVMNLKTRQTKIMNFLGEDGSSK